jgi:hypothetical protein
LDGGPVKNRELVQNIAAKLRSFNVQFRKVEGHSHDQWNDAADALAVKGRDDAATWPRCTFDVITTAPTIAFRERALRATEPWAQVYSAFKLETEEKFPTFLDARLFKNGAEHTGDWTPGHYQFVHKTLPSPLPLSNPLSGPQREEPAIQPVMHGLWNGTQFKLTKPFDITKHTKEERLRMFNEVHPVGDDVRYFVSNVEVLETELRAGQPYSIYPRRFERPNDTVASTRDKIRAVRLEGPLIHIQWMLSSETGQLLLGPAGAMVAEEISLPQLWHKCMANRWKQPVETIKWGRHFRAGTIVEAGVVSELLDNDGLEIIAISAPIAAPSGQLEVIYNLGEDPTLYRLNVKSTATMGEVKQRISLMHKSKPIQALASEGSEFDDADPYQDWMLRSTGGPRQIQAKIVPMVQVVLDYMGAQKQMCVRQNLSKEDFLSQAKAHLGTTHNLDARPLGLDDW